MLKMTLVLERDRQRSLCLGKTVVSQQMKQRERGSCVPWGTGLLKSMEFLDRVYYEAPNEQIRERQGVFSVFGPLCYSTGLWSNAI